MSNRDHTGLAVGASIAIVVTLTAGAVALEVADSENTLALMTLFGTLLITPVLGVIVPLIRGVNRAAATSEATAEGMKELKHKLNGDLDARLEQAVQRGTRPINARIDRIEHELRDVRSRVDQLTNCDVKERRP